MEMCYDGALVMPSSYAVMDENEMTYTEGGAHILNKNQCLNGLGMIGIATPQLVIAGALTFTMAKMLIKKISTFAGIAAKIVTIVLSWAASQIFNLGVAIARGALNRGVKIYWNWNIFKEPVGVCYSVL